jgi:hypothetical protein
MANTCRLDLDQNLAVLRSLELNGLYRQLFASFMRNCGPHIHSLLPFPILINGTCFQARPAGARGSCEFL